MAKQFGADYSGVAPKAGGEGRVLLPVKDDEGKRMKYIGRIVEAEGKMSKSSNPWVQYKVKVIAPAQFADVELPYQSVVFLPREHEYAGIALHFLKCILQPFEGKFNVVPDNWVSKCFAFGVVHEESTKTDNQGNPYINAKVSRADVLPIADLIELGVIDSADEAPDWLQKAEEALSDAGSKKKAEPAAGKPKAQAQGEATAAKKSPKKDEPAPDSTCEVCEREYKDHGKVKHEFKEDIPF